MHLGWREKGKEQGQEGASGTCLVAVSMHLSHWPCSTYRSKAATTSTPTSCGSEENTKFRDKDDDTGGTGGSGEGPCWLQPVWSLCLSHRVHFALVLEELLIVLVHVVLIPVEMDWCLTARFLPLWVYPPHLRK